MSLHILDVIDYLFLFQLRLADDISFKDERLSFKVPIQ